MPLLDGGPGRQDIRFRAGDTFRTEVDWSIDLTGYTVTSALVSLVNGATLAAIPTAFVDAAAGRVGVAFPAIDVAGTYGWTQTWVAPNGDTRTGLVGYVEVTP